MRSITAAEHRFLVNPMPVKNKKYRGQQVYCSANHIGRDGTTFPHPYAFMFVIR